MTEVASASAKKIQSARSFEGQREPRRSPGPTPELSWHVWLERFARHLLLLRPQLGVLVAAWAALKEFQQARAFDPEIAAAVYADNLTDV